MSPWPSAPGALIDFVATGLPGQSGVRAAFGAPLRVHRADRLDQVVPVLRAVQAEARAGHWCIGFVGHEAAPAFDAAATAWPGPHALALAWFGVHAAADARHWPDADTAAPVHAQWRPGPTRAWFGQAFEAVMAGIREGATYQVNLSARRYGQLRSGSPLDLFHALRQAQPGGYAAYLDIGDWQLLSVSPELFFDWDGRRVLLRPMKGTAARGACAASDAAAGRALRDSPKERAENVMIVDLVRNDISRVARLHSVRVPRLFHCQAWPTVWQMSSDVTAETREGVDTADLFGALFPCGSVTGAPRIEALRRIRALERDARGVYCGAIGVLRPGGGATFNVAIRTVVAGPQGLSVGIGSGITAGAQMEAEWREWQHKWAFVERASEPFDLLETLRLEAGVFRHLDAHLRRMADSARHFDRPWAEDRVRACLKGLASRHPAGAWRARLTLNAAGDPTATAHALGAMPEAVRLRLAPQAFAMAHSAFVRHKTTRRAHYDEAAAAQAPDVFDTVLWNEAGELTECTRGNLALRIGGQWLTPALACGLLPGIGREMALAEGRLQEALLRREDLARADAVAFVNSLRGWLPATMVTG